jgi:hypothetical protein
VKPGGKRAQRKVQADLEANRERLGITRAEEFRGLTPGSRVRLKRAGTGQTVCTFKAYFESARRGTAWVDVIVPDGKYNIVLPVRPDQIVKVRKR